VGQQLSGAKERNVIDDDDVTTAALAWPVMGPISLVLGILVIAFFAYQACENTETCEARECPAGQSARLLEGECLCVAKPTE
jgi:hypothetical protein